MIESFYKFTCDSSIGAILFILRKLTNTSHYVRKIMSTFACNKKIKGYTYVIYCR